MPPTRRDRLLRWGKRAVPWVSLVVGTVGALVMDRNPQRGVVVAVIGLATWVVLLVAIWLGRLGRDGEAKHPRARLWLGARYGLLLPALSNFVVLAAVLPSMGVPNGTSLWAAARAGFPPYRCG